MDRNRVLKDDFGLVRDGFNQTLPVKKQRGVTIALNRRPENKLDDCPDRELDHPDKLETETEIVREGDTDQKSNHPDEMSGESF